MELRDLIVTPIFLGIIFIAAWRIRPLVTDEITYRYFLPALTLKIIGAVALGMIYTFYYDGGDTFKYHTYGSRHIWNAIIDSPVDGFELLLTKGKQGNLHQYTSRILIFRDTPSFFVARIAAIFDLFTFSSYTATAMLFAVLSFTGMWTLFITFYKKYPHLHKWLAIAVLFIPSVIFWGSGILKDTVTLACIGFSTYAASRIFVEKKFSVGAVILLILAFYTIFSVKKYILLCLAPSLLIWILSYNFSRVRSTALKIIVAPFTLAIILFSSYYAALKISEDDEKYALSVIAKTARVTAHDIRYVTGREAGSGYDLGELDGTPQGMVRLMPQAINVSLFRPYLWEVRNPLMLLSALESGVLLFFSACILFLFRFRILAALRHPDIIFCLVFSLTLAFAVGVSTFNFGTLVRYKIPVLPFFATALVLIWDYSKRARNTAL